MIGLESRIIKDVKTLDTNVDTLVANNGKLPRYTALPVYKSGSTITTVTTGLAQIAGVNYQGNGGGDGDIDTLSDSADIDDPTWVDVVDLTGGPFFLQFLETGETNIPLHAAIAINAAETSGDSLRIQVLIDTVVEDDVKLVSDNATTEEARIQFPVAANETYVFSELIFCNSSFKIRVAKKGTFANDGSHITICSSSSGIINRYNIELATVS